jgi:transmembrane protein EpsG
MVDLYTYTVYIALLLSVILFLSIRGKSIATAENIFFVENTPLSWNYWIAILLISIVVGVRYNVGADWHGYYSYYRSFQFGGTLEYKYQRLEIGYYLINRIGSLINLSYQLLFLLIAMSSWIFVFKAFPKKIIPLFIFYLFCDEYFFWSMNGVRQFFAITIFLFALKYVIKRDFIKYVFLLLIASLIHNSVLLFIILYFIPFQKLYNQKVWYFIIIISFFVSQSGLFLQLISSYLPLLLDNFSVFSKYSHFINTDKFAFDKTYSIGLGFYVRNAVSLIILYFSRNIINRVPESRLYFILFFIGVVVSNIFLTIIVIERLNMYFLILRDFSLAIITYYYWRDNKYILVPIALLMLYFALFINAIFVSSNMCSPYDFRF